MDNNISFIPIRKDHFPLLAKWLKETHVHEWWSERKTYSIHDIENKYSSYTEGYKMEDGTKKPIHAFIITYADHPIGYIQYYNAFDFPRDFNIHAIWDDPQQSLAGIDFFIGDTAYLGKGIGTKVLKLFLKEYVFEHFFAALSDPKKANVKAIKAYEQAGFKQCKEISSCLVMIAKQIYLVPYCKKWPEDFKKEKQSLLRVIGNHVVSIEHIGSTAIEGLSAKPVIDIMIGVNSLEEADQHSISKIEELGYEYMKQYENHVPERRFFQKTSSDGIRTHHIHLVEINSNWWKRHLAFRDYLRNHPDAARDYENLKKSLAKKHCDSNDYAMAKTEFIRKIEESYEEDQKNV
ncbi:MAG: GNAT family N-acetyltransferase [Chlamydiales bacterium]|nr:GNAT family N-acetyltransferase [Chlamydiales bacterium]